MVELRDNDIRKVERSKAREDDGRERGDGEKDR